MIQSQTQSIQIGYQGLLQHKIVVASWESKPKGVKPKVLNDQKPSNFQHKAQGKKSKTSSTNLKGPIKIWVPKSEIVNVADIPKSKGKAKIMVPRAVAQDI